MLLRMDSEFHFNANSCWRYDSNYTFEVASPSRFCPTIFILDGSPACNEAIDEVIRTAAYALAVNLRRQCLPMVLVSTGNPPTIHLLTQPANLLAILTQRSKTISDPIATFNLATELHHKFIANDAALEPIILLFTHPQWGLNVDKTSSILPRPRAWPPA
jgi:hypothetical protein